VTTIAGSATFGHHDGIGTAAAFDFVSGLVLLGGAQLLASETYGNCLRQIDLASGQVTTVTKLTGGSTDSSQSWLDAR
jgi:hypothetical protein